MKSSLKVFLLICLPCLLISCGGGGGSGSATSSQTYQTVAAVGELLTYTVDLQKLKYAYEITESAYGLLGSKGEGTLTANGDGTYTPSGFSAGRFRVLENGLMYGSIYEDFNADGNKEVVPVLGVSNPISSASDAQGVYNFVSRQCVIAGCVANYGTLKINSDGTWQRCNRGNLGVTPASPACVSSSNGTYVNFSGGKADKYVNGQKVGTFIFFKDSYNQKVILTDLNGADASLGKGAFFASSQGFPSSVEGTWFATNTAGTVAKAVISGSSLVDTGVTASGMAYGPLNSTFQLNQPWTGMATISPGGSVGMLTGSGMGVTANISSNHISIGVR